MSDLSKPIPPVPARSRWARFPPSVPWALILLLAVIFASGCGPIPIWPNAVAEAKLQAARTTPVPGAEADLVAELYASDCAGCHGRRAEGLSAIAAMSEAEIFSFIAEGDQPRGMPAYGNTLSRLEIEGLGAYLSEVTGSVGPGDSAAAASILTLQAEASNDGDTVTLSALLTDQDGNPIAGAQVDFVAQAPFGDLPVGGVTTNADGRATLTYDLAGARLDSWAASYVGDSLFGSTSAEAQANLAPIWTSPRPTGSLITSYPPLVPTLIVAAVVGSVWSVFAYAAYQLVVIGRTERSQSEIVTTKRRLS